MSILPCMGGSSPCVSSSRSISIAEPREKFPNGLGAELLRAESVSMETKHAVSSASKSNQTSQLLKPPKIIHIFTPKQSRWNILIPAMKKFVQ